MTSRPLVSLMFQSMILSVIVLRKSASNGVSIGDGHTELVRTPRRIVGRDERIVYTWTSSFEKKYGCTPSAPRFASVQSRVASQSVERRATR